MSHSYWQRGPLVPGRDFLWRAPFDIVFRLSVVATFAATLWAVSRLLVVWFALRGILRSISATPLVTAFERLPRRISRLTRLTLHSDPSRTTVDTIVATQWSHLRSLFLLGKGRYGVQEFPYAGKIRTTLERSGPMRANAHRVSSETLVVELQQLWRILELYWAREPHLGQSKSLIDGLQETSSAEGLSTSGRIRRNFPNVVRLWLRTAEEFVAVQVIDYVAWVMRYLRRIVILLMFMLVLLTGLLSSYAYSPESLVRGGLVVMMVGIILALVTVLVQMNRDEILSRVMRTDPGRVTWSGNFLFNVAVVTGVPLLGLMGSSLPWLRDGLFGWIDPLFRLVTKQ